MSGMTFYSGRVLPQVSNLSHSHQVRGKSGLRAAQERSIGHASHDLQQAPSPRTSKFARNCAPTANAAKFNEAGRFM